MDTRPSEKKLAAPSVNDRVMPRWQVKSIACALLCGERWHDAAIIDISLGGMKVRGRWNQTPPVTAVSLADMGPDATDAFLILQSDVVWVDSAQNTTALRFDVPNPTVAANLLNFLSRHLAAVPSC